MNPTKKQKILLDFINGFVGSNGYSPTYREVMRALGYKSVSTVAKHIDNLIVRGWLVKREGEARSLEVVYGGSSKESDEWGELEREIKKREESTKASERTEADILRQALTILRK